MPGEHVRPALLLLAVDEQHEPDPARNQRQEKPRRIEVHRVDNTPVHLTRRELLEMTALLAVASTARPQSATPPHRRRAAGRPIRAYSAEGHHRTATVGRSRVGRRAARPRPRDRRRGVARAVRSLARRSRRCLRRRFGGQRIDGLPMFDGPFTDAGRRQRSDRADRRRSADRLDAHRAERRGRAAQDARRLASPRDRRGDDGREAGAVSGERRLVQRAVRSAGAAGVERAARGDRSGGVRPRSRSASSRTRRGSARRRSTSWPRFAAPIPRGRRSA